MSEEKRFCVYEHIRLDNNQCFYVGKGTLKRARSKRRNEHHDRIVAKYGMKVNIYKDNLTEEEAYEIEQERIRYYVYELHYGIDIIGFNNNKDECGHLTNASFGGEGSNGAVHSEEWCKQHSEMMKGENNPMYGKNALDYMNNEDREKHLQKMSERYTGKNNPMYGVSPKERMDEETYSRWYEKRKANSLGENNPNYGNDTLHKKLLEHPELKVQYYSRPGGQNGRAVSITMFDNTTGIEKDFDCTTDCAKWIQQECNIDKRLTSMITSIKKATLNSKTYLNRFTFKYN